jgi:hypothetical protein
MATNKNYGFYLQKCQKDACFDLAHVICNLQLWDLEELLNTPEENSDEE